MNLKIKENSSTVVETLRTDADTIHVSDFGIKWVAYGKYSKVEFSTEKISWEQIDAMILGD
jgi:hypothetical protein